MTYDFNGLNMLQCIKWHCLQTRDGFYPVDRSRDILGTNVCYYPVANSRNVGVQIRVLRKATSQSSSVNSNQSVIGNQRATVILK
jgi:hypothetical protein